MLNLREIEARANAAIDGPWSKDEFHQVNSAHSTVADVYDGLEDTELGDEDQQRANAAFIAAARTDVPALVRELASLRKYRFALEGIETDYYGAPLQRAEG